MQENTKDLMNEVMSSRVYELGYHILPTVGEESLELEVSKLHSLITDKGGIIISEEFPQMKNLAYEMQKAYENKYQKFNRAYFGWIKFELDSSIIGDISNVVTSNPNILRFIIVKTVRENTIYNPKIISKKEIRQDDGLVSENLVVSDEEIDKSIDDLLIEEDK